MALGISAKKTIAACILPRYSPLLNKLNWNRRWIDTVKAAKGVPRFREREGLYAFVHESLCSGAGPVDYLEFGVYRGASLRHWCQANTHPESRFFGFDSFEGLPEDWSTRFPKGFFNASGKLPNVSDPRLRFVVGWFQKSLPRFLAEYTRPTGRPVIIHNDCDLYSSTLYCLSSLNATIGRGTVIIFDEFDDVVHEYRALTDYTSAFMRTYRIVAATDGFHQAAVEIA